VGSDHNNENFYASDILLGAISPPYFFAPTIIQSLHKNNYVLSDAAIFVDNPALAGLLEGLTDYPHHHYILVSLNAGLRRHEQSLGTLESAGLLQWMSSILPISIQATSEFSNHMVQTFFKKKQLNGAEDRYYSFNVLMPKNIGKIDDTSRQNIIRANKLGERLVERHQKELDELAQELQK